MQKFIVYLTINTVNRKIYVGVHKCNPDVFDGYIGNGVIIDSNFEETTHFRRAIKKYGFDKFERITLGVYDTVEEAYSQESDIVTKEFVSRNDTYNMALGGYSGSTYTKNILQYSLSGKFIKKWDSLTDVATYFNKKTTKPLIKALKKERESYLNYQWTYYTEDYPLVINSIEAKPVDKIYQYSLEGDFINEYISAHAAAKELTKIEDRNNATISNRARIIVRAVITGDKYAEFQWRKFIDSIPLTIEKFEDKKTVYQLDFDLNIINTWKDKSSAEHAGFEGLSKCLNGKAKSAHGFMWCYKKDYEQIRS